MTIFTEGLTSRIVISRFEMLMQLRTERPAFFRQQAQRVLEEEKVPSNVRFFTRSWKMAWRSAAAEHA